MNTSTNQIKKNKQNIIKISTQFDFSKNLQLTSDKVFTWFPIIEGAEVS